MHIRNMLYTIFELRNVSSLYCVLWKGDLSIRRPFWEIPVVL
jgi:hypothetical protein